MQKDEKVLQEVDVPCIPHLLSPGPDFMGSGLAASKMLLNGPDLAQDHPTGLHACEYTATQHCHGFDISLTTALPMLFWFNTSAGQGATSMMFEADMHQTREDSTCLGMPDVMRKRKCCHQPAIREQARVGLADCSTHAVPAKMAAEVHQSVQWRPL